jgi:hypothetical protein
MLGDRREPPHRAQRRASAWLAAMLTCLACLLAEPARAVSVYTLDPFSRNDPTALFFQPVCNIKISGPIVSGDHARIKEALENFGRHPAVGAVKKKTFEPAPGEDTEYLDFYPKSLTGNEPRALLAVCLSGPGGNITEALKIAPLFRNWIPVVEDGDSCISACAVLFMKAGARRDHVFYFRNDDPGRFLHFRGKLGFHAPSLPRPEEIDTSLTPQQVGEAYRKAYSNVLRTMSAVMFHGASLQDSAKPDSHQSFLNRWAGSADLPADLIMAFLLVPPEEIYLVSKIGEAIKWGIEIFGVPAPPVLSERMLRMACQNVIEARCSSVEPYERHEGECHQWVESAMVVDGNGNLLPDWHSTAAGREHWTQRSMGGGHPVTKRAIWPATASKGGASKAAATQPTASGAKVTKAQPKGPPVSGTELFIQGFEMGEACQVAATWHRGRLHDLEVTTFNGIIDRKGYDERMLDATRAREILDDINRGEGRAGSDHLSAWKTLPAEARLESLGKEPWGWLAEGGNFFDRPPNW